jgi:hypothetical protein
MIPRERLNSKGRHPGVGILSAVKVSLPLSLVAEKTAKSPAIETSLVSSESMKRSQSAGMM